MCGDGCIFDLLFSFELCELEIEFPEVRKIVVENLLFSFELCHDTLLAVAGASTIRDRDLAIFF